MTDVSYELHRMEGAKALVLTFGSFTNPGRSEPSYAFMQTCLRVQARKTVAFDVAYFKARENDWYFSGIEGLGLDHSSAVSALKSISQSYDRVICIGNSMGAYGTLVFGGAISADAVLAFSPKTRSDAVFRATISDKRWNDAIAHLLKTCNSEAHSVSSMWASLGAPRSANVIVGGLDVRDQAYAEDVAGLPFVKVQIFAQSGHDLVHSLRESGVLDQMILDSVVE